ncbi:precorrin-8X methylmutase [Acidianus sulfidivorans JP7]|uniref:Precorrin-8X methylmutase n=1 Tax=Acidianus sulfidivorans JP7 TaxID=619593 RepID=A0A2U9IK04_9CREN|nr:precorrin-8X methylmutase [Acidianus sulfidivorans]AWR96296.1 precorrin-8X methylmutase [Acidianus sulfidivorans JP7]
MKNNNEEAIVIITHGSRRGTFVEDMQNVADFLEDKLLREVILSHNEFTEPNWRNVLDELTSKGVKRIVFALAFLGRGNHIAKDIMGSLGLEMEFYTWKKTNWKGKEIEVYFTRPLADSYLVKIAILSRISKAFNKIEYNAIEDPYEIENRTMNIIREEIKDKVEDPRYLEIYARAVYATGNLGIIDHIYMTDDFLDSAIEALRGEIEILADIKMVAVGIRWNKVKTLIDDERTKELAKKLNVTRAEAGVMLALKEKAYGLVIGNSPTAILGLLKSEGEVPFVIATPPGFTNAKELKDELVKRKEYPSFVVKGNLGGSNIAVSVMNELIREVKNNG